MSEICREGCEGLSRSPLQSITRLLLYWRERQHLTLGWRRSHGTNRISRNRTGFYFSSIFFALSTKQTLTRSAADFDESTLGCRRRCRCFIAESNRITARTVSWSVLSSEELHGSGYSEGVVTAPTTGAERRQAKTGVSRFDIDVAIRSLTGLPALCRVDTL